MAALGGKKVWDVDIEVICVYVDETDLNSSCVPGRWYHAIRSDGDWYYVKTLGNDDERGVWEKQECFKTRQEYRQNLLEKVLDNG
jgi:hypothetical protein